MVWTVVVSSIACTDVLNVVRATVGGVDKILRNFDGMSDLTGLMTGND